MSTTETLNRAKALEHAVSLGAPGEQAATTIQRAEVLLAFLQGTTAKAQG